MSSGPAAPQAHTFSSISTQNHTIDGSIRKIVTDIIRRTAYMTQLCEYDTTDAFVECKDPTIKDNKMLLTLRCYVLALSAVLTPLITIIIYYIGTGEDLPDNGKDSMIGLGCACLWLIFGFLFFNSRVTK